MKQIKAFFKWWWSEAVRPDTPEEAAEGQIFSM